MNDTQLELRLASLDARLAKLEMLLQRYPPQRLPRPARPTFPDAVRKVFRGDDDDELEAGLFEGFPDYDDDEEE